MSTFGSGTFGGGTFGAPTASTPEDQTLNLLSIDMRATASMSTRTDALRVLKADMRADGSRLTSILGAQINGAASFFGEGRVTQVYTTVVVAPQVFMRGSSGFDLRLPYPYTVDPILGREQYRLVIVTATGESEEQRVKRLIRQIRRGEETLDGVRRIADKEKYGNTWQHWEPLPTDPALDKPYLADDTALETRIRQIFTDRTVPLSTAAYQTFAELDQAHIERINWELNGLGSMDFTLSADDPKAMECVVPKREVQVWRGRTLIWWGVLVRARASTKDVSFQALGLGWYFTRRVVGPAKRPDLMKNGSFEESDRYWSFDYSPTSNVKSTPQWDIVTAPTINGRKALRLRSSVAGHKQYARQRFLFTVPVTEKKPKTLTLTGWVYVEEFVAGAAGNWGIYLELLDTKIPNPDPTNAAAGYTLSYGHVASPIDEHTPLKTWVRMEVSREVPADGKTYLVDTRIFAPQGVAIWDEVGLTVNERLGFYDADQSKIIEGLVLEAQDPAKDKSPLNIDVYSPDTGIVRNREYLVSDRIQIMEAIEEFPTLADGMDWDITLGNDKRVFTTYFPEKGRLSEPLVLGRNILEFQVDVDGNDSASTVIVMAEGEGSDREEGMAKDTNLLDGLVLEKVYNSTPGSAVSSLQAQANRGLRRYRRPVVIPQITTHQNAGDLINAVKVGDVCMVDVKKGWVDVEGYYRVTQIDLDPNTEQLTFSVYPYEPPNRPGGILPPVDYTPPEEETVDLFAHPSTSVTPSFIDAFDYTGGALIPRGNWTAFRTHASPNVDADVAAAAGNANPGLATATNTLGIKYGRYSMDCTVHGEYLALFGAMSADTNSRLEMAFHENTPLFTVVIDNVYLVRKKIAGVIGDAFGTWDRFDWYVKGVEKTDNDEITVWLVRGEVAGKQGTMIGAETISLPAGSLKKLGTSLGCIQFVNTSARLMGMSTYALL